MQYGALPATEATFAAACMLLAGQPAYASSPLRMVVPIRRMIQRGHSFGAIEGNRLVGFVAWHEISSEMAHEAIQQRQMPKGRTPGGDAGALLLATFVAPSRTASLAFFRRFAAAHKGKILIGERHYPSGKNARFFWVDRSGKPFGADL